MTATVIQSFLGVKYDVTPVLQMWLINEDERISRSYDYGVTWFMDYP